LPPLLRALLLLLPVGAALILGLRALSAARVRTPAAYTYFQFMLTAPSPKPGAPMGRAPRPFGDPTPLRLFTEGVDPAVVQDALRRRNIPFELVGRNGEPNLWIAPPGSPPPVGAPASGITTVTEKGLVTMRPPSNQPLALAAALDDGVWWPVSTDDVNMVVLGGRAIYGRPDAQAIRESKAAGRSRPAPAKRWASMTHLVGDVPRARLVPAIQSLRAGETCTLDFQVLGYDDVWYSVTARTETRFRVVNQTEALIPYGTEKGAFIAPAEARVHSPQERLVVEAVLEGPSGLGLTARAVVVVLPN